MGTISMSLEKLKQYRLAMEVIEGKITIKEFSLLIGKSYRQSQRIVKNVRDKDTLGVVHGNKGRAPINKTSLDLELRIIDLLKYKYYGFNLTHFKEMIEKNERIKIKKDTLHRIAKKHNLIKHPKKRARRVHKPRARLPREGMMIQFDGSNHVWFGDRRTDLIAGIDDATGKIVGAEFFYGETSNHSLKVIRDIVDTNGLPESFYMDQAGIFGKKEREWESQISRAFEQTGVQLILAGSSQAKGRIERLWRTLQDRLVAEFKLKGITTIEEANEFLKNEYIERFNRQFSVTAKDESKAYRKNVFGNLDMIYCKKIERKIGVGNVFYWDSMVWVLESKACFRGRRLNINLHLDGSYSFDIMGRKVQAKILDTRKKYYIKKKLAS